MPRRREVPKRDILPDPKFGNVEVSKFVNTIMKSGKKSVAERIVYGAFDQIVTKIRQRSAGGVRFGLGNIKPWSK
jgi:small subunit ribosomal protein S7